MRRSLRLATALLTFALLSACANSTAQVPTPTLAPSTVPTVAPTAAPTATPAPTAVPKLADDVRIAGVDVSSLTLDNASTKLEQELAPLLRPLELEAGNASLTLKADTIKLALPLDAMIAEAQQKGAGARVALDVSYDKTALRSTLDTFAEQATVPAQTTLISETGVISRSFAYTPAQKLDVENALKQVDEGLRTSGNRRVTLKLTPDAEVAVRPAPEQLQAQIEDMAKLWDGVVGVYVYDLASDKPVAALNEKSVFSGASVMKVPILLHTYIKLPTFTDSQKRWLQKMIVDSDNFSANNLLASSMGGAPTDTDEALAGALDMSDMLRTLGLEHTYQNMPYESADYLINLRGIKIKRGPAQEGPAPYTEADPVLRTTPSEMSQVFVWLHQCSQNKGVLLEKFGSSLNPARCQEMLDLLAKNADHSRIVAGLPEGTQISHKSGWVEDMQSDIGLIHSPGGDFLVAVYLYRSFPKKNSYLADEIATPVIARFARMVYTYYNPIPAS